MESVSEKIKKAREAKNFSQKKLAEIAGVSQPTIYNVEHGKVDNITLQIGNKIANALGISFGELFNIEFPVSAYNNVTDGELERLREQVKKLEEKVFKLQTDLHQRDSYNATLVQYKDILKYKLIEVIFNDSNISLSSYQQRLSNAKDDKEKDYYECKIEQEESNRESKIKKLIKSGFFTQKDIDDWVRDIPATPDSEFEFGKDQDLKPDIPGI